MNATQANHPTGPTLHAYGLGKLEDLLADAVNKHLETCPDCRHRVAELSSDSFLSRLRDAQENSGSPTPVNSATNGPATNAGGACSPIPESANTLPPGLLNHPDYEILRELGRGGMGVVYLAQNKLMGRQEVLKLINSHLINRPGVMDRFLAEIRNAARLHHPNIVTAYSALRFDENLVLAMEYVEGLDLARTVKTKGPLSVVHACYFIHQAALGLQYAHELGMVHRDIKPSNLMLVRFGNRAVVKILDFGLAKVKRERTADGSLTAAGQWLGTPEYIAPEQINDARQADIRADIYSLGCTFYELLTGRPPFQATTLYEIYQAHHSMDAPLLNLVRPDVPMELAVLVATMLAKEPERRFQTPKGLAQALIPFLKKETAASQPSKPELSRGDAPPPVPQSRGADQAPAPTTRVVSLDPAVVVAKPSTPPDSAWDTLVEINPQADLSAEVRALRERRGVPAWLWPLAAAALLVIGIAVGWKLSIDSKTNQGESGSLPSLATSTRKTGHPGTARTAPETPRAGDNDRWDPIPSDPESPKAKPAGPDRKVVASFDSENTRRVDKGLQNGTNLTAKEQPADSKPVPTPIQTLDSKAKLEDKPSPEDSSPEAILLAKHGLKKEGRFYVIATEYQVRDGYDRLVPYWKATEGAWSDLTQAVRIENFVQGLDDLRINLQSYINDLDLQLRNLPSNPATAPARQALQQERQAADANLRNTNREFAIAVKRRPGQARIDRLSEIFLTRRAEFYEESNKLKPIFDKVSQEYEELKKDTEVTNAIKALKEERKAAIFIGPSEFCKKAFSQIKDKQRMLSLNPDAYRRANKPKLKQSPKSSSLSMPSSKTTKPD